MSQSKSKSNGKKKVKIIEVPYKPRTYQQEVHSNLKDLVFSFVIVDSVNQFYL